SCHPCLRAARRPEGTGTLKTLRPVAATAALVLTLMEKMRAAASRRRNSIAPNAP
ncbi:hypothetical protein M9458_024039, partial [Cirrhinus mrigala]